jgi:hypothetical protein
MFHLHLFAYASDGDPVKLQKAVEQEKEGTLTPLGPPKKPANVKGKQRAGSQPSTGEKPDSPGARMDAVDAPKAEVKMIGDEDKWTTEPSETVGDQSNDAGAEPEEEKGKEETELASKASPATGDRASSHSRGSPAAVPSPGKRSREDEEEDDERVVKKEKLEE